MQVGELLKQHVPKIVTAEVERQAQTAVAATPNAQQPNNNNAEASDALRQLDGIPNGGDAAAAVAARAPPAAAAAVDMETEAAAGAAGTAGPSLSPDEQRYFERYKRIQEIISGVTSIGLYLEFLYSHNHADLQVGPPQIAGIFAVSAGRHCRWL